MTTMKSWLAEEAVLSRVGRTAVGHSLRRLARVAGPIGIAVAVALDTHEFYSHVIAYQRGDISRRQMTIAVTRAGGGIAGGIIGAKAGAVAGAWIGTFGGPYVWLTVPVGATAGATIGGIFGYFGGSTVTGTIAEAWYAKVDERVKVGIDEWIVSTSYKSLVSQAL